MKERRIYGLEKRDDLIRNLVDNYRYGNSEKITILTGNSGCGKSYVLKKVINNFNDKKFEKKICTFINFDNSFIQPNIYTSSKSISDVSFSVGNAIATLGIGIGIQSKSTQYNLVKRMLEEAKNQSILICIDDFTNAHSSIRLIYNIIINNIEQLEAEISGKIFFLITDSQENVIYESINKEKYIEKINLETYTIEDIIKYLEKNHLNLTVNDKIRNNIMSIEKICNGNLFLIDFMYVDISIQDNTFFSALEKVVNYRMQKIKESGKMQNISMSEMEDIILSASLSLQRFSINEVSLITQRDINIVATGFDIARENTFIDKSHDCYYDFCCSEIKDILCKESIYKRKERLLSYYQYYTDNEPDEYFFRAYYLTVYSSEISSQAFALFALALIYGIRLSDDTIIDKIEKVIKSYNSIDFIVRLNCIKEFYQMLSADDCPANLIYSKYKEIKNEGYELPLQAELTRACFYYMYRKCAPSDEKISILFESCIQYSQNKLSFSDFSNPVGLKQTDEAIIRLNIIYTIAPYIIDVKNDVELFNKIYTLSQSISMNGLSNRSVGIAKYIENVFNRKAFLFVNQSQCDIYYEKAKSFFQKNQIWDELCITLICQAGTNIVIQQFEDAKNFCEQAFNIAKDHNISIPQPAKAHNNLLIAEFLETEKEGKSEKKCKAKAKQTIKELKNHLTNIPSATEYVILTNLCSLSLYCDDDTKYLKYKKKLEKLMNCTDVSDISDENIDDFYRYYFAWFETFRMMQNNNWEKAEYLCSLLNEFIPSLFKKQEIFWAHKHQALSKLIENKTSISAYDFCLNLVHPTQKEGTLSKFFFRGLMVSDLQYTSYI